jgi:hypothetical protein
MNQQSEQLYPEDPLVQQDLEQIECSNPLCDSDHPIYINAKCHTGAGLAVSYDKDCGCLNLLCSVCNSLVARVAVQKATVQ